jgi:hypothetical protein
LRTDHRQADAGVAAGCLDDGLPGSKFAGALGVLDHAKRQTILDRTERIECLNLDEQVDPGGAPAAGEKGDRLMVELQSAILEWIQPGGGPAKP